jgi:hypothetical protein
MTTIVERTPNGTIYRSAKDYPIPDLDVLTLLFGTVPPMHIPSSNNIQSPKDTTANNTHPPKTLSTA